MECFYLLIAYILTGLDCVNILLVNAQLFSSSPARISHKNKIYSTVASRGLIFLKFSSIVSSFILTADELVCICL